MNRGQDALSKIFVETDRFRNAAVRLNELIDYGQEENYCKGLLLRGPNGVGKTILIKKFRDQRLGAGWENLPVPPILYVEVPSNSKRENVGGRILSALRAPDPDRGDEAEMTRRIESHLKKHGVILLVVDEINRLIDSDTDTIKRKAATWLSSLLNIQACPILLVGEPKAERLFADNGYLTGRTEGEIAIAPHDWTLAADRFEFASILHVIGKNLGLADDSDLGKLEMAHLIHQFSGGVLREAVQLIDRARRIANRHKRPKVTLDLLEQAADELRIGNAARTSNPFRAARQRGT